MSKFECITFPKNPARDYEMGFFDRIPFYMDDRESYLKAARKVGYDMIKRRNRQLLEIIGPEYVAFMRARRIGYNFIIHHGKFGKTKLFDPDLGEIFRGNLEHTGLFLKIFSQANDWKKDHLADLVAHYLSTGYRYMPDELERISGVRVPASKGGIGKGNGLSPDYREVVDLPYGDSLMPLIYAGDMKNANVRIVMMGDSAAEIAMANKLAGLGSKVPELYVWHHLDDFDPITHTCTIQLVLKEFHNKVIYRDNVRHVGSSALFRHFYFMN